jgi:threonine/homoserine/homoserine lactone efflux protein
MEWLAILAMSFVTALSGALMPGPMLTVTLSEGVKKGHQAGLLIILGHGILEFALILLLLLGAKEILQDTRVSATIGVIGGLVLGWMAWGMFRSLPTLSLNMPATEHTRHGRLVWTGALVSAANPYWSIWWATIGLSMLVVAMGLGWVGAVVFFIGHISADLLWYVMVAEAVWKGRRLMSDRVYRRLIGVCAAFLLLLGGSFIGFGMKGWLGLNEQTRETEKSAMESAMSSSPEIPRFKQRSLPNPGPMRGGLVCG